MSIRGFRRMFRLKFKHAVRMPAGLCCLLPAERLRLPDRRRHRPRGDISRPVRRGVRAQIRLSDDELRRLRTPHNAQCGFLRADGCSIHPAKPTQCRIFPFWPELVEDKKEWHKTSDWCPGIGKGELVQIETARVLAQEMREGYPTLYR